MYVAHACLRGCVAGELRSCRPSWATMLPFMVARLVCAAGPAAYGVSVDNYPQLVQLLFALIHTPLESGRVSRRSSEGALPQVFQAYIFTLD